MSTRSQRQKGSPGLKALVLTGLLLLAGSTSANFIEHSNHHVIAEPKLINIPSSARNHGRYSHWSQGHRHKVRSYQKKTAIPGAVVEVPYTIWAGTFEELNKRQSTKDVKEEVKTDSKDTTSKGKEEEDVEEEVKQEEEDTVTVKEEEEDSCTGIVCSKGFYCTQAGCCPDGKKCTGITTCLDATDSQCPDNIACCPGSSPICQVTKGQALCMRNKQEEKPTTTSQLPTPTPTPTPTTTQNRITKADVTTSSIPTTTTSSEPETTSTEEEKETSISKSESTSESSTTSTVESSASSSAPPSSAPTEETVVTPSPDPVPVDVPSTTSAAPTPSSTDKTSDLSDSSKIISGAVAGSIVALAFGSLIIYTIVKKRKENALARAEEARKEAPLAASSSAAPMGSGGNGRPFSIQAEPEMLQMGIQSSAPVFASGPHQGRSLREGIPPPSPPPNAVVVGTPPYRRDPFRDGPGTPTSLRAGFPSPQPQQSQWDPVGEYPQNFPLPEGPLDSSGYQSNSGAYLPQTYTPAPVSPPPGTYQAYSSPSTPR